MVGVTPAGQETAQAIRREAAASFAAHGYEATSLRQVAAAVGIKVGSLYNHISSKEELLMSVMGDTMHDLLAQMEVALDGRADPVDRLVAGLHCHIRFHAERAQEVFIGNSELRSLPPQARAEIIEKRRDYRRILETLIEDVAASGAGEVLDTRLHAFSIVAIGTHVAGWFRPEGERSLEEIINTYTAMILRSLSVPASATDLLVRN